MMKILLALILCIRLLLYLAETKVTVKPFSVSFGKSYLTIGWIFIIISFVLVRHQGYSDGLKRGKELTIEATKTINQQPQQIK